MPAPDEHLLDLGPLLAGGLDCLVGLDLVVDELAVAVVRVHGDEDRALRVRHALAAGGAGEAAEDLGVDHAETGAGEHRDR